jgi:catechol 2,3-dioxygenase-like lactoylglutathione lyase family enzyme
MITGIHTLIYASDADKVRAFFRDVLQFPSVDVGHGWMIFALPPAELGIHPTDGKVYHELYLMCDDVKSTVALLKRKGVQCAEIRDVGWGSLTSVTIPGGGEIGLYEPRHKTAIGLASKKKASARKPASRAATRARTAPKPKSSSSKRKPRRR